MDGMCGNEAENNHFHSKTPRS